MPYYHSNVDSDEVMFYVGGDYEARKGRGINIGSISLHPGGHAHGPQPSAIEASIGVEDFDELAVMVDTFRPLELGEGGLAAEDPAYAWTWAGRGADATRRRRPGGLQQQLSDRRVRGSYATGASSGPARVTSAGSVRHTLARARSTPTSATTSEGGDSALAGDVGEVGPRTSDHGARPRCRRPMFTAPWAIATGQTLPVRSQR